MIPISIEPRQFPHLIRALRDYAKKNTENKEIQQVGGGNSVLLYKIYEENEREAKQIIAFLEQNYSTYIIDKQNEFIL
ncbi:MAG: hypothetical protein JST67_08445 [Bacteroidetes bacterium]|nr:hypothetical protein [Bacteroidota bacterium]